MPSGVKQPLEQRFWLHVNKNGPRARNHEGQRIGRCWVWTAYIMPGGYGQAAVQGSKATVAHRVAWLLHYKEWPVNHLDHLCSNRACVRWSHLEDVTQAVNNARSPRPRALVCRAGHDLTLTGAVNRKRDGKNGGCRLCGLERSRAQALNPGSKPHLTDVQKRKIMTLHRQGLSGRKIAERVGSTGSTVNRFLARQG